MTDWQARVVIAGVPSLPESDVEAMQNVIRGVMMHNTAVGELELSWRFTMGSDNIIDAINHASHQWRVALQRAPSAWKHDKLPMCVEFHVQVLLMTDEEAERRLAEIFKDRTGE